VAPRCRFLFDGQRVPLEKTPTDVSRVAGWKASLSEPAVPCFCWLQVHTCRQGLLQ
jgi:hypothetical protein